MTVIAAIKEKGEVWVGCDSQATGYNRVNTVDKFICGENFTLICSGTLRGTQIIGARIKEFKVPKKWDIDWAIAFAEWMQECNATCGAKKEAEHSGQILHSTIYSILVTKNKIFGIGTGYSVIEMNKYAADGSGGDYAMGAIEVLKKNKMTAKDILLEAIKVACKLDPNCGGKIHIKKV